MLRMIIRYESNIHIQKGFMLMAYANEMHIQKIINYLRYMNSTCMMHTSIQDDTN